MNIFIDFEYLPGKLWELYHKKSFNYSIFHNFDSKVGSESKNELSAIFLKN